MARNPHTAAELEAIADELQEASSLLRASAAAMRERRVESVLLHSTLSTHTHVPAIVDWSGKVSLDVKAQIRAHVAGIPSRAEILVQQNEQAKKSAARKPRKKSGS